MRPWLGQVAQVTTVATAFGAICTGAFIDLSMHPQTAPRSAAIIFTIAGDFEQDTGCQRAPFQVGEPVKWKINCGAPSRTASLEIEMDGRLVYQTNLPRRDVTLDNPSSVYQRIDAKTGEHEIVLRLRDSTSNRGFVYYAQRRVALAVGRTLVIEFRPEYFDFAFHWTDRDVPERSSNAEAVRYAMQR